MKVSYRLFLIANLFFSAATSIAQPVDKVLQDKLAQALNGFRGQAGYYIKHLSTGRIAGINYDTLFPTASMVKVPIAIGIADKLAKEQIGYHQEFMYKDSLLYEGEDILGSFRDGEKIQLSKLIMLMLTTSDNTASLWLQSLAGSGVRINELLSEYGLVSTRVNSRTAGREEARKNYGWGQTSPREMVLLFEKLYNGEIISRRWSEQILRWLGRNYWDEEALSQLPPYVFVASKNGAVNQSRSETMLVMAPSGPYIFSVITQRQVDERWDPDNEGWVLARRMADIVWKHFEPKSAWSPGTDYTGKPINQ